ncbi:hypothetical protein BDV10DRAFT_179902 [Aspergillus recurvatus]
MQGVLSLSRSILIQDLCLAQFFFPATSEYSWVNLGSDKASDADAGTCRIKLIACATHLTSLCSSSLCPPIIEQDFA